MSSSPDAIDRAHLTGSQHPSPVIPRYPAGAGMQDVVAHYWAPAWSTQQPLVQRTLQHPAPLIVITPTYARFYGITRGMSSVVLSGDSWAFGVMLRPGAGVPLLQGPMSQVTDRFVDLAELPSLDGAGLRDAIREALHENRRRTEAHLAAAGLIEQALHPLLPLDEGAVTVNRVVDLVRADPTMVRVGDLADRLDMTQRSLQRLVERRLGVTVKWILQRTRVHRAVVLMKDRTSLAEVAASTGYVDQAHFTHDFRAITGMTPGEYARDQLP